MRYDHLGRAMLPGYLMVSGWIDTDNDVWGEPASFYGAEMDDNERSFQSAVCGYWRKRDRT